MSLNKYTFSIKINLFDIIFKNKTYLINIKFDRKLLIVADKEPFDDEESLFPLDVCRFEEFGSADDWTGRVAVVIFGAGVVGIEPVEETYPRQIRNRKD